MTLKTLLHTLQEDKNKNLKLRSWERSMRLMIRICDSEDLMGGGEYFKKKENSVENNCSRKMGWNWIDKCTEAKVSEKYMRSMIKIN